MSLIDTTNRQIFYVDSRKRLSGIACNFTYKLEIDYGKDYDSVVLTRASIPKSYYMVQNGLNTFVLTENGVDTIITIPAGNYTRTSFRTIVQQVLNSSSPNNWTYEIVNDDIMSTEDDGKYYYWTFLFYNVSDFSICLTYFPYVPEFLPYVPDHVP